MPGTPGRRRSKRRNKGRRPKSTQTITTTIAQASPSPITPSPSTDTGYDWARVGQKAKSDYNMDSFFMESPFRSYVTSAPGGGGDDPSPDGGLSTFKPSKKRQPSSQVQLEYNPVSRIIGDANSDLPGVMKSIVRKSLSPPVQAKIEAPTPPQPGMSKQQRQEFVKDLAEAASLDKKYASSRKALRDKKKLKQATQAIRGLQLTLRLRNNQIKNLKSTHTAQMKIAERNMKALKINLREAKSVFKEQIRENERKVKELKEEEMKQKQFYKKSLHIIGEEVYGNVYQKNRSILVFMKEE